MLDYANGQGRGNGLYERVKVVLLLHCLHDGLEVLSDILAKMLRQVDVLHCRVCSVDNFLVLLRLAAHLSDQDSKLTENVGLEDGTSQVDNNHEDDLGQLFGTHLVTTDNEH